MNWPYYTKQIVHAAEALDTPASHDPWQRWVYGVVLAGIVAAWAMRNMLAQIAPVPQSNPLGIEWRQGTTALLFGMAYLGCGLLLHFHYFWSGHPRYFAVGLAGKAISLLLVVIGLLGFIYHELILG